MPNYRLRYSRRYFTHLDLPPGSGDLVVTIAKVDTGTLKNEAGVTEEKPFLWFEGHNKPFGCNATNGATIAALYGDDDGGWLGRQIALFRTKTNYGGRLIDCIRVKPEMPAAAPATAALAPGKRGRKAT